MYDDTFAKVIAARINQDVHYITLYILGQRCEDMQIHWGALYKLTSRCR